MRSFIVKYWRTDGRLIIGRPFQTSARWGLRSDAESFIESVRPVRPGCEFRIVESSRFPEIFPHCPGHPAQAIGGLCFGCGKELTVSDAKQFRLESNQ